ncbi:aminoacyl-histidine dipeptidase [Flavobacteriaceae bacterium]|nr:aminoacyl-histidine dipeptidase [Flavobacteriaceae bacterium]
MSSEIRNLEPSIIWNNFCKLNAVPRPSKKEEKVIKFMHDFGVSLGLETQIDKVGNVVIFKPATDGMENRKTVVLQSHLDMVHEKNNEVDFDFEKSGIQMYVDNDWVRAKGTTLGADNGLGVATIMSVLESNDIAHPKIEALFTIDEETGMTGALKLDENILKGDILLNLDTEEDDEIGIGCAGGVDITISKSFNMTINPNLLFIKITLNGLSGGHSGMEIHKNLGNSNKLLNKIISDLNENFLIHISEINGGGLRNAIPRESSIILGVTDADFKSIKNQSFKTFDNLKDQFLNTDPLIKLDIIKLDEDFKIIDIDNQTELIKLIRNCPNGVYKMSDNIPGLVETSNNLANISLNDGNLNINCLTRSSDESSKEELKNIIKSLFINKGYTVDLSGDYPGWQPNMSSEILAKLVKVYKDLNSTEPNVAACHAGLECGIIGSHYPKLDMISFGPTIRGAHSPDERASIKSTIKFWRFLKEVLLNIPLK